MTTPVNIQLALFCEAGLSFNRQAPPRHTR
jgi:hypothetical protein